MRSADRLLLREVMGFSIAAAAGLALLLAFANGANDVSKGIATLVGSGVSRFRAAMIWGTAWTVAGGLLAAFVSQGLVATLSGKGFLNRPTTGAAFLVSVAIGASAWVLFASRTGLPVSTTHSIAGALAGAGIVAEGAAALHWSAFAQRVALPLGLSPLISVLLIFAIYPVLSRLAARAEHYCICLERRWVVVSAPVPGGVMAMRAAEATVVGSQTECAAPTVTARLSAIDALHWFSSALTSFARGLNDTPKIVALGIAASAAFGLSAPLFYAAVAFGIGAGSLVAGFRVTETLARRVTPLSHADGFAANLVTTLLVGAASVAALPVSTTHVSSGAIIGVGLHRGTATIRWRTVRDMLLAWLVTLPAAGLVGAAAYALLSRIS